MESTSLEELPEGGIVNGAQDADDDEAHQDASGQNRGEWCDEEQYSLFHARESAYPMAQWPLDLLGVISEMGIPNCGVDDSAAQDAGEDGYPAVEGVHMCPLGAM